MKPTRRHRLVAILGAGALIAAACGNDDPTAAGGDETAQGGDGEGEGLVLGHLFPETGDLASLGPPPREGVQLAVDDINAAGGVLGQEVTLRQADEAGDEATARESVDRLLGEGAHAILGAGASGMSQAIIQSLFDNQVVQCSGSNTSPEFSDQDNAQFYFRTVPPDEAVTPVIVDEVIADGAETVAIAGRADDYGDALSGLLDEGFAEEGVEVTTRVSYEPELQTVTSEVEELTAGNPDAIVLVSFDEGAQLIGGLLEAGVAPDQLYGADGLFSPALPGLVDESDPNVIDGMTIIGAAGDEDFNARLTERTQGNLLYGAQYYDCTIVTALAAQAADTTDSSVFTDEMINVTRDGTECTTFEECRDLIDQGEDIDYTGVAGNLDMDPVGDPTFGRYAIAEFTGGELEVVASQDVDLEEA